MLFVVVEIILDEFLVEVFELFKKVGNDEMWLKFILVMVVFVFSVRIEVR